MTLIHTATEDELSESIACNLIRNYIPHSIVGLKLRKGGIGYLKSSLPKFLQMANRDYLLLLVDLDRLPCAPMLVNKWFGNRQIPQKFLFRIVVREIESWILADRHGIAKLFEINEASLPPDPDDLSDPKQTLLRAARRAPRAIRSEILRSRGSISKQGLGYNRVLVDFVENGWQADRARLHSPSLDRALNRLSSLDLS